LIDIGSNLTHASFAGDRDAVVARAVNAGVLHQVVTGADWSSSAQAAELAVAHPGILSSTAGIHPHHAAGYAPSQRGDFARLLERTEVVAVGECGLDYFRDFSPRAAQRAAFIAQLELAAACAKPVFLHQRDAHEDFTAILREYIPVLAGGVAHCFTGGIRELEVYLALGLSVGITGWVCDERRGLPLREAVPRIPAERFMLETDAPYLLPRDLNPKPKSRRNEPCFLPHIAAVVAALRGESVAAVAAATTRNAERFFGLAVTGGRAANPGQTPTDS
jgi:TatD DNase family protein